MSINDRVRFAGRSFDLVRVVGPTLFEPRLLDIQVVPGLSACPRGHYAVYDLEPRLMLQRLHVRLTDDSAVTPIAGVSPTRRQRRTQRLVANRWVFGEWPAWDHVYRDLAWPLRFTGSLWLAADRIAGPLVGAEPLMSYCTVWDVLVEDGVLKAAIDQSPEVAGARARHRAAPEHPDPVLDQLH